MDFNKFFSPICDELEKQKKFTPDKLNFYNYEDKDGSHFPKLIVISSDSSLIDHSEKIIRDRMEDYINYSLEQTKRFNSKLGVKLTDSELIKNKKILRDKLERKLKRYNAIGNVVSSVNVAHKTKFKASSLFEAVDAYLDLIHDNVSYAYDLHKDTISMSFESYLRERAEIFKEIIETNFPDWSRQITLFEHTGYARLLTFFDKETEKTIHKNIGNFFLILQDGGSLELQEPPFRRRRADNVFGKAKEICDWGYDAHTHYFVYAE